MKNYVTISLIFFFFTTISLSTHAQGFHDLKRIHSLLESGKKKMFRYQSPDSILTNEYQINLKNRTVTSLSLLRPKNPDDLNYKKHNDSLYESGLKTYYFNQEGICDSTISKLYAQQKHIMYRIIFHLSEDGKRPLSMDRYVFVNGNMTAHKTKEYEHDSKGRVLKTKGAYKRVEYDNKGRISKEYHEKVVTREYKYDNLNRLIRKNRLNGAYVLYDYNEESLLKKVTYYKKNGDVDLPLTHSFSYK